MNTRLLVILTKCILSFQKGVGAVEIRYSCVSLYHNLSVGRPRLQVCVPHLALVATELGRQKPCRFLPIVAAHLFG